MDTAATCGSFTGTGWLNTLTVSSTRSLTIVTNFTIPATATIVNSGTIIWGTTGTAGAITVATTIPGNFTLGGSGNSTRTIGANLTCSGAVTMTGQQNINGAYNMYFQNGFEGGGNVLGGTCSVYLQGGQLGARFSTTNVYLDGNLTCRAGTTTFSYVGFGYLAAETTVTWLSGTFTTTASFIIISGNVTFNTGSDVVFDKIQFLPASPVGNATLTLADDLYIKDILLQGASDSYTTAGAFSIKCSGSLYSYTTNSFYSIPLKGASTFEMVGTGTLGIARNFAGSASSKAVTYLGMNVVINTAGTMTWGAIGLNADKTLTYTAGTLAGSGTVYVVGTYSFSGDITYPNMVIGFLDSGVAAASDGPYVCNLLTDCTLGTLTVNYNSTINITDTKTVDITGAFASYGNIGIDNVVASTGTGYINHTGTQNITHTDFTNINSTNKLYTFNGDVTTCTNVEEIDVTDMKAPLTLVVF